MIAIDVVRVTYILYIYLKEELKTNISWIVVKLEGIVVNGVVRINGKIKRKALKQNHIKPIK